mgnify:CR=1 FL=1
MKTKTKTGKRTARFQVQIVENPKNVLRAFNPLTSFRAR